MIHQLQSNVKNCNSLTIEQRTELSNWLGRGGSKKPADEQATWPTDAMQLWSWYVNNVQAYKHIGRKKEASKTEPAKKVAKDEQKPEPKTEQQTLTIEDVMLLYNAGTDYALTFKMSQMIDIELAQLADEIARLDALKERHKQLKTLRSKLQTIQSATKQQQLFDNVDAHTA